MSQTRVYIQAEGFVLHCPKCNEPFDVIEIGYFDGSIELECFECMESSTLSVTLDS